MQIDAYKFIGASLRQLPSSHMKDYRGHYKPLSSLDKEYETECDRMKQQGHWKLQLCDVITTVFSNRTQAALLMFTSDTVQEYIEFHLTFVMPPVFAVCTYGALVKICTRRSGNSSRTAQHNRNSFRRRNLKQEPQRLDSLMSHSTV